MKYQTIFFDLDETLWDYRANAEDTIDELFELYALQQYFTLEAFKNQFFQTNKRLWTLFDEGKIEKLEIRYRRFELTLQQLEVDDLKLSKDLQESFMNLCPKKSKVFPNAKKVVEQLLNHYDLHIITNGFEDIQHQKLRSAGLLDYFGKIVTSEMAGAQKPQRKIFDFALQHTEASAGSSLMIGDNLAADVLGAKAAGLDAVYFNPDQIPHSENPDHEVQDLSELAHLLL